LERAQISVEESAEQTKPKIRCKPPNSGKGRTVALPKTDVEELRNHHVRQAEALLNLGIRLSEDTFVIAQADGSPSQPRSITHAFHLFLAKHKLPRIRLHDLRHPHATAMLKNKVHPKVVQDRLGHSTIAITMDIYSHVLDGMQEDAAETVDAVLQAALIKRRKQIG
jgi:integrase